MQNKQTETTIPQQASKAIPPDAADVGNTIRNRLYGTRSLDTDDVDFAALRLHATYRKAKTDEEKRRVLDLVDPLVSVYDLLTELPVRCTISHNNRYGETL